jgi:endoglucanase
MLHPRVLLRRLAVAPLASFFLLISTFASAASAKTPMQEYVEAMQPGINLGNSLDATPNETAWGNPPVSQEFIQQLKAQGFKSIRLPVTWNTGGRVGPAPTYTIDPAWMDRVQQVIDWSLDAGLYVMVNMHHDTVEMRDRPADYLARYTAIWEQIAARFRDHPRELHFESINEPQFHNVDIATDIMLVNELNEICFDVVRGTGGGNATRPIVMPTVVTNASQHYLDGLKALMVELNDPNLIATIHFYGWWPFSVNIAGGIRVDDEVIADINGTIDRAYATFVADGIPVVVGEFGLLSFDSNNQAIERGELLKFFELFAATAQSKSITWQLWDAGYLLYDRNTSQLRDPELYNYLMRTLTGRSSTGATDLIFVRDGTPLKDVVIPLNLNGNSFLSLNDGATPLTLGSDYMINGSTLTVKASALAAYASGSFGEKTVLTANFSGGPGWKLHVRHTAAPVLAAASGTKSAGLVIPAVFNGDLVATMEAKYVGIDFPFAGPHDWTSFKQYNETYFPNYTNNTIAIRKNFFDSTTNNPIDLTFHFWSGRKVNYRLTFQAGDVGGAAQEWVVSEDGLPPDWNDWTSWAPHNLADTTIVHSGASAISITPGAWGAVGLSYGGPAVDTSAYKTLTFWIHGGTVGGQNIGVGIVRGDDWSSPWQGIAAPAANTWRKVEIPLSELGVEGSANISRVFFQNWTGADAPTFYVDDIKLTTTLASHTVFVNGAPAPVITSAITAQGVFNSSFSYATTAINSPTSFSATGLPPGLAIDTTTGVISGTPTTVGSYPVSLSAINDAGAGTETLAITIDPAPVSITLGGGSPFGGAIKFAYDGAAQSVADAITTSPTGVSVMITYNGSTTPPKLPGTYDVVVTSNDPNYAGVIEGKLEITVTALVRHAPSIGGDIDGSLQLLNGESFTLTSGALISGDLLAPGTPTVLVNGKAVVGGIVVDAAGDIAPSNYSIALNKGAAVRYVVRRVDPLVMPVVTAPALPAGTRSVTLTKVGQNYGAASTLRNLTLSASAGSVALPAGVYGNLAVNGSNSLELGVAGASEPAVYELQGLSIGHNASVKIVGPVTLKLASGSTVDGVLGSVAHPEWLELEVANGGLTVNGAAAVYGVVTAPNGAVNLNGSVHGRVNADQLTINGSGLLEDSGL